jgi:hypothetical protein
LRSTTTTRAGSAGRQFFVTTPFVPAIGASAGREFLAVFLFDQAGALLEARIDDLDTRATFNKAAARALLDKRVAELGPITFEDIEVQPFSVERFGVTFGLIPRWKDHGSGDDGVWIELHPGNYMASQEPCNGEYDT